MRPDGSGQVALPLTHLATCLSKSGTGKKCLQFGEKLNFKEEIRCPLWYVYSHCHEATSLSLIWPIFGGNAMHDELGALFCPGLTTPLRKVLKQYLVCQPLLEM